MRRPKSPIYAFKTSCRKNALGFYCIKPYTYGLIPTFQVFIWLISRYYSWEIIIWSPFPGRQKLTNEYYIVFVVFVLLYCCHCAVFSEWPDRALSRFHKNCDLSTLFEEHKVVWCFDSLFCSVQCSQGLVFFFYSVFMAEGWKRTYEGIFYDELNQWKERDHCGQSL